MSEIRSADPGARRRALWLIALAAAIGLAMITLMPSVLRDWLQSEGADPVARGVLVLRCLAVFLATSFFLPAAYLFAVAARVDDAREFPPPGMALVRDMKVLRGEAARGRAWLLRAIAIKLALLALAGGILIWILAGTLVR